MTQLKPPISSILKYKFWDRLKELPYIEKIYIFGSRARGDNLERSDIDMAIWCPKAKDKDWSRILDIIENSDTLLEIDCVRLDNLAKGEKLREKILDQGIMIYEKKKNKKS